MDNERTDAARKLTMRARPVASASEVSKCERWPARGHLSSTKPAASAGFGTLSNAPHADLTQRSRRNSLLRRRLRRDETLQDQTLHRRWNPSGLLALTSRF